MVQAEDMADDDTVAVVKQLRTQGYGIFLCGASAATVDKKLLHFVTHLEMPVSGDMADMTVNADAYRTLDVASTQLVARNVQDWQQYDVCASLGVNAFVGNIHLTQRHGARRQELNPAQAMILEMMDMVRNGADVKDLEGVLKRDAALSYKLLRYINSAGFGLGCEVHSMRHAVTLLGYSPLYRWLALLMATATTTGFPPVLMQAAVIRGRFTELLATGFLPKSEAENLFVAGMFSLLDRLLGMPMDDVLEKIQLSDAVSEALLSRGGIYGPFVALAEACELNTGDIDMLADSLCISAEHVNQAHLAALAWAQILHM
jgi:EAL and modified HD-GYP domain-containing signal transduction protein